MFRKPLSRGEKLVQLAQKSLQESDLTRVVVLPAESIVYESALDASEAVDTDNSYEEIKIISQEYNGNEIHQDINSNVEINQEINSNEELNEDITSNTEVTDQDNSNEDLNPNSLTIFNAENQNTSDDSDYQQPTDINSSSLSSSDSSDDNATLAEIQRCQLVINEKKNQRGRPRKGRNRKYPRQTFKIRKLLKNSNKPHYSVIGRKIEAKSFIDFDCKCKMKCREKISLEERQVYFQKFWDLASYETQSAFLAATVQIQGVKRKRNLNSTKRSCTRVYKMGSQAVCREMFVKTYQISTKRIQTAIDKLNCNDLKDKRGTKTGGFNKCPEGTVNAVISHIASFPTYVSHYTREKSDAKYLHPDLSVPLMHSLYLSGNNPKVSLSTYKKIFYENFNLRRKPPIKDTCSVCDTYHAKLQNTGLSEIQREEVESFHTVHLNKAKEAREAMKADFLAATKKSEVLSYDMQKVLSLPKLPTNITYYKRQLSVYNEGIHSASTKTPYCFIWREGVSGRGAQEVGSCIKLYVEKYLDPNANELILWSDSCGGQNRNIKIVLLLKAILSAHNTLQTISLKYLIPGHSFLANDTDFGEIERGLKYQLRVYTIEDFKHIILSCTKKRKFVVTEMKTEDFYSVEEIEKVISNRKILETGEKVDWLNTRVIKLKKKEPYTIFFKHSHSDNEDFKELKIEKRAKGNRLSKLTGNFDTKLKILHPEGKPISEKKLADIQSLMSLVPDEYKSFYTTNLDQVADFEDDLEGFGQQVDFDIEEN